MVGRGYTGGRNVDVAALGWWDRFGTAVSLNGAGNRLAVGAPYDDGSGQSTANAGAVYLFTFADTQFSGGRLAVTLGKGYAGGLGVDVAALEGADQFGRSVSLSRAGTRLAVGAPGDDGAGNGTANAGAVYLFTFADTQFSGGRLAVTLGRGYAGGREVDVAALEGEDQLGLSVALNGAGTRLAVGAPGDDGAGNGTGNAGAVYLFTFADTQFSGGRLAVTLGRGYTGGRSVDVAAVGSGDQFGAAVSLNGSGNRLAVGAPGDDGAGNRRAGSGAVYLFTFADTAFSSGRLVGTAGRGYTGGRNIDVVELGWGDRFGTAVSLSGSGTRLAAGAVGDDGADNRMRDAGAVYLFTFTDTALSRGRLAGTAGKGFTGGWNVDVGALESGDRFGAAVSLNGSGTRLAVGASGDAAVYLFTFTDTEFSGGRLAAIAGKGYTGGRNVDVASLEEGDRFGAAVSLNGSGNRLAVGAPYDSGRGNMASGSGAVYLFTFTDTVFSGGRLAAIAGKGYTGGRNIDVTPLEGGVQVWTGSYYDGRGGDRFGTSVSLNAAGDRLAAGAARDDGPGEDNTDYGAVYLFTFTDPSFSGGTLAAIVGKGYTGGRNIDVDVLAGWGTDRFDGSDGDQFGAAVSLNGAGTRLAVGAPGDEGAGAGQWPRTNYGAVYLFTFTDRSFSGGRLAAVMGKGYAGARERRYRRAGDGRLVRYVRVVEPSRQPSRGWGAGTQSRQRDGASVHLHQPVLLGRAARRRHGQGLHRRSERRCHGAGSTRPIRRCGVTERFGHPSRGGRTPGRWRRTLAWERCGYRCGVPVHLHRHLVLGRRPGRHHGLRLQRPERPRGRARGG